MDDRNAARQIAAIFGRSCREPGDDPGLDPALDSAAEVVARIRAEALREASERASAFLDEGYRDYHDRFRLSLRAAILSDEPKEREAGYMIEARVWENGEWRIEASSREAYKIDPRASFILVPVMSRAEVERKLKEAER